MEIVRSIEACRLLRKSWLDRQFEVCLVPTMGALHAGHLSLIEAAQKRSNHVVVSIFVNPKQFGPSEDYTEYPRTIDNDLGELERLGISLVFIPEVNEMYSVDYSTHVMVETLGHQLCGRSRPTHFRGVSTVILKLFNLVQPQVAFFGQKDAQQSILIQKMVKDLNLDIDIVVCPTVREKDGLAISSRNQYLTHEERMTAPVLYRCLVGAIQQVSQGERLVQNILGGIYQRMALEPLVYLDYVSIVDPNSLQPISWLEGKSLLASAVFIGKTRLIDNTYLVP